MLSPSIYTDRSTTHFFCSFYLKKKNYINQSVLFSSGRTPAGMSVLGSYFGSMPTLPALVLTHLPSGSEIYQYPSNTPIAAPSVLQWLQRVEDGAEKPAGKDNTSYNVAK